MVRLELRMSTLPLIQAVLTGLSTGLGVLLVILWRPNRKRFIPFYSDASHNDPERIILACGENLACIFMPIVAICEYLHHTRLLDNLSISTLPILSSIRCIKPSPKFLIRTNVLFTSTTSIFFFLTSNVPSKYPATKIHQFAASSLILFYAIQATLKAILSVLFNNYKREQTEEDPLDEIGKVEKKMPYKHILGRLETWWHKHHLKIRISIAVMLWIALIGTWICFSGRVIVLKWRIAGHQIIRQQLSTLMAVLVHLATMSCLILMSITAIDMRAEKLVLQTRTI